MYDRAQNGSLGKDACLFPSRVAPAPTVSIRQRGPRATLSPFMQAKLARDAVAEQCDVGHVDFWVFCIFVSEFASKNATKMKLDTRGKLATNHLPTGRF